MTIYHKWLFNELKILVSKNVISSDIAEKIKNYYKSEEENLKKISKDYSFGYLEKKESLQVATKTDTETKPAGKIKKEPKPAAKPVNVAILLSIIAGVLVGTGVISLIAYNWASISLYAKAVMAFVMLSVIPVITACLRYKKPEKLNRVVNEFFAVIWSLLFAGSLVFISQIFRFQSNLETFFLVWFLSSYAISYLYNSKATFAIAFAVTCVYMGNTDIHGLWLPYYGAWGAIIFAKGRGKNKKSLRNLGLVIISCISVLSASPDIWRFTQRAEMKVLNMLPAVIMNFVVTGVFLTVPVVKLLERVREKKADVLEILTSVFPIVLFAFVVATNFHYQFGKVAYVVVYFILTGIFAILVFNYKKPLLILPLILIGISAVITSSVWIVYLFGLYIICSDRISMDKEKKKYADYLALSVFLLIASSDGIFYDSSTYTLKNISSVSVDIISLMALPVISAAYSVKNKTVSLSKILNWIYYAAGTVFVLIGLFTQSRQEYIPVALMISLVPVSLCLMVYHKTFLAGLLVLIPVLFNTDNKAVLFFAFMVILLSDIDFVLKKFPEGKKQKIGIWAGWGILVVFWFTFIWDGMWAVPETQIKTIVLVRDWFLCAFAICMCIVSTFRNCITKYRHVFSCLASVVVFAFMVIVHFAPGFAELIPEIMYAISAALIPVYAVERKNPYIPLFLLIPGFITNPVIPVPAIVVLLFFISCLNITREGQWKYERQIVSCIIRTAFVILLPIIGTMKGQPVLSDRLGVELTICILYSIFSVMILVMHYKEWKQFDVPLLGFFTAIISVCSLGTSILENVDMSILQGLCNLVYVIIGLAGFSFLVFRKKWEVIPYVIILPAMALYYALNKGTFYSASFEDIIYIVTIAIVVMYLVLKNEQSRFFFVVAALMLIALTFLRALDSSDFFVSEGKFLKFTVTMLMMSLSGYTVISALMKFRKKESFNFIMPLYCVVFAVLLIPPKYDYFYKENVIPVIFLILAFMVAIYEMVMALRVNSMKRANIAAGYMLLAIVCRLIDDSISFVTKGIIFILCGLAIFAFNMVMLRNQGNKNENN